VCVFKVREVVLVVDTAFLNGCRDALGTQDAVGALISLDL